MKHILTFLCLNIFLTSCNKTTPAGFWTDFHKDLIVTKESDQGPWGGQKKINWKSKNKKAFSNNELIEFAEKNGWKFIDSISFSVDTLIKDRLSKLKIDDYSQGILFDSVLKKCESKNNKILVFKTTWLKVEPGNTRETFENGFAILNSDGTELIVFHIWGE